jgi:hypothetical protein
MTRLSITLCAVVLSISLAPAAQAYAVEPAAGDFSQGLELTMPENTVASDAGVCTVQLGPLFANLIGVAPDGWTAATVRGQTVLACNDD